MQDWAPCNCCTFALASGPGPVNYTDSRSPILLKQGMSNSCWLHPGLSPDSACLSDMQQRVMLLCPICRTQHQRLEQSSRPISAPVSSSQMSHWDRAFHNHSCWRRGSSAELIGRQCSLPTWAKLLPEPKCPAKGRAQGHWNVA